MRAHADDMLLLAVKLLNAMRDCAWYEFAFKQGMQGIYLGYKNVQWPSVKVVFEPASSSVRMWALCMRMQLGCVRSAPIKVLSELWLAHKKC
eukprot:3913449-Pleurochrysis_carterae.AAC.1